MNATETHDESVFDEIRLWLAEIARLTDEIRGRIEVREKETNDGT